MSVPSQLKTFQSTLLKSDNIKHGFFSRRGGVSSGVYQGLNVGLGSNDNRDLVLKNRDLATNFLVGDNGHLQTLYQIHSNSVVILDDSNSLPTSAPEADGLVTNQPNLMIGILTADCAPVLFADPVAGVVGACHAGWKGALSGVVKNTVQAMVKLGASTDKISATVGPCIAQKSYEVSDEFLAQFLATDPTFQCYFLAGKAGHHQFDLPNFVKDQVIAAGVESVEALPLDTYELEQDFYSYRRMTHKKEADYGRQLSAIALEF